MHGNTNHPNMQRCQKRLYQIFYIQRLLTHVNVRNRYNKQFACVCSCVEMLLLYLDEQRWYKISYRDMSLNIDCHCVDVHVLCVTSCKLCCWFVAAAFNMCRIHTIEIAFFFSSVFHLMNEFTSKMPLFCYRSLSVIFYSCSLHARWCYKKIAILQYFLMAADVYYFVAFHCVISVPFEWPTGMYNIVLYLFRK